MIRRYLSLLFLLFFVIAGVSEADARQKKRNKANFRLVEAYSQRTLPGIPGAAIHTNYYFIIIWEGAHYPETFFWRGDNGWLTCNIAKAHKVVNSGHKLPQGLSYAAVSVTGDDIHKGDTLELRPISGGKFPIPAEIPPDAKNTLYYKTGGSGWLSFPVKDIGRKPDVAMP